MYYNKETKNKSFITMWHKLQDDNVENNIFMLQLNDKSLKDFDLSDLEDLSMKERAALLKKVRKECEINIWFFFREIVRVPTKMHTYAEEFSDMPRYILTEAELEMIYLYDNEISFNAEYNEKIRFGYKTTLELLFFYELNIRNRMKTICFQSAYHRKFLVRDLWLANMDLLNSAFLGDNIFDNIIYVQDNIDDNTHKTEVFMSDNYKAIENIDRCFIEVFEDTDADVIKKYIFSLMISQKKPVFAISKALLPDDDTIQGRIIEKLMYKNFSCDDFYNLVDRKHGSYNNSVILRF